MMATIQVKAETSPNGISKRKPSRPACIHCHQRKVRCDAHDRGIPCTNCPTQSRTDCRIHEKKKRPALRSALNPVPIRARETPPSTPSPPNNLISSRQSITGGTVLYARPPSYYQPFPPVATVPEEGEDNQANRHLVEFIDQEDIERRQIGYGVRLYYVGTEVSNLNFLVRQRQRQGQDVVHHFASQQLSRRYTTHELDRIPPEAFILPEKVIADELIRAYFTHVNPGYPIVDEEEFMGQYNGRDPNNPPSLTVLQAILLVGAHVSRARPDRDALKVMFFRRAKMLFDARYEQDRLMQVQAALLMTWHSDGAEDIGANTWYWVGQAARTALGLGMHRDATPSTLIAVDKRTWRRVWWILVQYDVLVSLSYGRPQAIHLDDSDVPPLTTSDFEGVPNAQKEFVIHHTELCVLISYILRERFGLRLSAERRKAALIKADETLANWFLLLPDNLRLRSPDTSLWPSLLHLTYNNFLILLHRPHPRSSSAIPSDHGPNDGDICSAAASVIASVFESLRARSWIPYVWISGVNALFTAMIQVSVELRFSNPVLAINALRRFDSTLYSLRMLSEYWLNASSVLRLFEERSDRLQRDIRMEDIASQAQQAAPTPPLSSILDPSLRPTQDWSLSDLRSTSTPTIPTSDIRSTSLPNFTKSDPVVAKTPEPLPPSMDTQQQEDGLDWRSLFPFTNPDSVGGLADGVFADMEDEWREIYWKEPALPEALLAGEGDGDWFGAMG